MHRRLESLFNLTNLKLFGIFFFMSGIPERIGVFCGLEDSIELNFLMKIGLAICIVSLIQKPDT